MALFRRRREPGEAAPAEEQAPDAAAPPEPGSPGRPAGPFDEADADLADQSLTRIDLGSLRVPGLPGVGVQVEADRTTQQVKAVTGVVEGAAVQLQVFAAPRSEGLWDEIRAEMLAEIRATDGARVTEQEGPFGSELHAVVPARSPEGKPVRQTVRFAGIDGPRWFLRAVYLGRAAQHPDPDDVLHRLVRETVVVRGTEAMAPRDPLPLHLPPEAGTDGPGDDGDEVDDEAPDGDLDPFERGPEITETR